MAVLFEFVDECVWDAAEAEAAGEEGGVGAEVADGGGGGGEDWLCRGGLAGFPEAGVGGGEGGGGVPLLISLRRAVQVKARAKRRELWVGGRVLAGSCLGGEGVRGSSPLTSHGRNSEQFAGMQLLVASWLRLLLCGLSSAANVSTSRT